MIELDVSFNHSKTVTYSMKGDYIADDISWKQTKKIKNILMELKMYKLTISVVVFFISLHVNAMGIKLVRQNFLAIDKNGVEKLI